jgi:hypothetical protein
MFKLATPPGIKFPCVTRQTADTQRETRLPSKSKMYEE